MVEGEIKSEEGKPRRWDYETHFREYLLLLARKKTDALEFTHKFPRKIELSNIWQETLGQMEEETKDGHERWALVGFREEMRQLVLPRVFGIGTKEDYDNRIRASVPAEIISREIQKAKERAGVIDLVGDIHSHPNTRSRIAVFELFDFRRIKGSGGGFSPGDLYRMVIQEKSLPMTAVVDGGESFFAFKTRESVNIPTSSKVFSQDSFEKYWYERYGVQLEGDFVEYVPPRYSPLELNKGVAARHNLVLYKGKISEDLERVYPE